MMINKHRTSVPTTVANGPGKNTKIIGDLPHRSIENKMDFCLTAVHPQESFGRHLMSIPVLLKHGCKIVKICTNMIVIDGPKPSDNATKPIRLIFRQGEDMLSYLQVKGPSGPVHKALSATLIPNDIEDEETSKKSHKGASLLERAAVKTSKKLKSIDIIVAHELLGHPAEKKVRETANIQGWKLAGIWRVCEWCDQAKARQKNIAKVSEHKTTRPGAKLHLDLTGPFKTNPSNSCYALMIVDDFTDRKWIYLLGQKLQVEEVKGLLDWLNDLYITCKYLQMDRGGENQPMKKL